MEGCTFVCSFSTHNTIITHLFFSLSIFLFLRAFSELQKLNLLYPTILYPAFKIQHTLKAKTLGLDFFFERKQEFHDARNEEHLDKVKLEKEQIEKRNKMRQIAVRREMGFWRYYCCWSQRDVVLAKILPDLEPPVKKKQKTKIMIKRKTSKKKGRKKINIRKHSNSNDEDYKESSERRREERRRSRDALGRSRISKKNKSSHKTIMNLDRIEDNKNRRRRPMTAPARHSKKRKKLKSRKSSKKTK